MPIIYFMLATTDILIQVNQYYQTSRHLLLLANIAGAYIDLHTKLLIFSLLCNSAQVCCSLAVICVGD